ncbi:MAG: hypothetical protein EXR79_14750 [Myxococcales bacterium]|nr:hypothetical protein [Myxococcales bacterium]
MSVRWHGAGPDTLYCDKPMGKCIPNPATIVTCSQVGVAAQCEVTDAKLGAYFPLFQKGFEFSDTQPPMQGWSTQNAPVANVSLKPWSGKTVQFGCQFDTLDGLNDTGFGVLIDDVGMRMDTGPWQARPL